MIHVIQSKWRTLVWVLIGLGILVSGIPLWAGELKIYAAASLADALKEIAPEFEKTTGDKLVFNLGASSLLARQIGEGAPADVFFSADDAKMNTLENKGLTIKSTRRSLLSNSLVVVVAAIGGSTVSSIKDLAGPKMKRIALAETKTVPAGIYAREFLEKQKLWSAVEGKVVPTENVRGALAAVESGNVDAAIVYKTDAAISKQVKVALEIPQNEGPKISYPVAVLKETKQIDAARRFLKHLESDDATKIFLKHGFLILKPDGTTP